MILELDINDISQFTKISEKTEQLLNSREFKEYIAEKILQEVKTITYANLNTDLDESAPGAIFHYRMSHEKEILNDGVYIHNDSEVNLDEAELKPSTLDNYPEGLSLAKLVEYGTGVVGAQSAGSKYAGESGWQYDVNGHGANGWWYVRDNKLYWTKGMEGKLIYHKLEKSVRENFAKWTYEYLKKNLNKI